VSLIVAFGAGVPCNWLSDEVQRAAVQNAITKRGVERKSAIAEVAIAGALIDRFAVVYVSRFSPDQCTKALYQIHMTGEVDLAEAVRSGGR
jgi:hypothetical protein